MPSDYAYALLRRRSAGGLGALLTAELAHFEWLRIVAATVLLGAGIGVGIVYSRRLVPSMEGAAV